MTKPLVTLPCSARELENALHAVCDHGLWDAKVYTDIRGHLTIEAEEKEVQRFCGCCANKECEAKGATRVVVCDNFK